MGINFHPYIIGRIAYKDGHGEELVMLEDGFFDPIWGQFNAPGTTKCTLPCLEDYGLAFLGKKNAVSREWVSFGGEPLPLVDGGVSGDAAGRNTGLNGKEWNPSTSFTDKFKHAVGWDRSRRRTSRLENDVEDELAERAPVNVEDYDIENDPYPPNNRTLENFFRGSWAYHVHNQVNRFSYLLT